MRVLFAALSVTGGAGRALSNMANYWARKGWPVVVAVMTDESEPGFSLHPSVEYRPMGVMRSGHHPVSPLREVFRISNLDRFLRVRRTLAEVRPDIVISFMEKTNVAVLFSAIGLGLSVIVSERTNPFMVSVGGVWNFLRAFAYRFAHAVVVQTSSAKDFFSTGVQKHTIVIPNPLPSPPDDIADVGLPSGPFVTTVGRLAPEKGYDMLIRAFSMVAAEHPEWKLLILGEGAERNRLEVLCSGRDLRDRVLLPGWVDRPWDYLRRSELFVLSSHFEGFPNALCEAMACGLAVIATDCPSGPSDIVRDGVDGILIPPGDVTSLARAMGRLMGDERERHRMSVRAEEVLERFNENKVMEKWESILPRV